MYLIKFTVIFEESTRALIPLVPSEDFFAVFPHKNLFLPLFLLFACITLFLSQKKSNGLRHEKRRLVSQPPKPCDGHAQPCSASSALLPSHFCSKTSSCPILPQAALPLLPPSAQKCSGDTTRPTNTSVGARRRQRAQKWLFSKMAQKSQVSNHRTIWSWGSRKHQEHVALWEPEAQPKLLKSLQSEDVTATTAVRYLPLWLASVLQQRPE